MADLQWFNVGNDASSCTDSDEIILYQAGATKNATRGIFRPTNAETKIALEANADTNTITDAQATVLGNTSGTNTGDETAASVRTLVGAATDSNVFTDADHTKLDGIASGATDDQTGAEIKAAYEAETNAFTDAQFTKLAGIEDNASADQTNAEIRAAVEAATDSNVFTDADHTKLDGVESSADVTDAANVTAAGAVMDSECTSLTDVKELNQSVVSGASPIFVTTNMTEGTDKNFVSDAEAVVVGNTSGTNTGDQTSVSGNAGTSTTLATAREIDGVSFNGSANIKLPHFFVVAAGNESTAHTTGSAKTTFYSPNYAITLTDIYASLTVAPTGATFIADVHAAGSTVMTTDKLDIEATELHTSTAATQPALTTTAIAANTLMTIDIDTVGSTIAGAGLKVYFEYTVD